jgi:hypothetical protein
MSAMGWTLHDDQSGSNYQVWKSNGENSDRIYEYIKIDYSTANTIACISYGYWNATTHTGSCASALSAGYSVTTSESGFYLWIYGNKNLVYICTKVSSTYYKALFGHLPTIYWNTPISDLTQAASSGTNVTIHVTSTSGFVAGNYYQIFGATGEGRDKVQVSSITNSTDMVIASLPRNYGVGSLIGSCPSAFGVSNVTAFYNTCAWLAVGTAAVSSASCARTTPVSLSYETPDVRSNMDMLQPMIYQQTYSGNYGLIGYCDSYLLTAYNSAYNPEDTFAVGKQDTGTAESGGNSTLTDTDKSWSTNAWTNKVIVITFGTGIGQIRKIASNTATEITITGTWTTNPSSDSQYIICDEAYRVFDITSSTTGVACREGV